ETKTRSAFLASSSLLLATAARAAGASPVVDIHQHTNYSGRSDADLLAHQKAMGATHTVLLPAGSMFGLDADCGGNESVVRLAAQDHKHFWYFSNEVPYLPEARPEIEKYLKRGAIGIGEQKFKVD